MEDAVTYVITRQDHTIVAVTLDISLVLTEKAVMVGTGHPLCLDFIG